MIGHSLAGCGTWGILMLAVVSRVVVGGSSHWLPGLADET